MKAKHVVTGGDRDKAYGGIIICICLILFGIAIIGGTGSWVVGGILFGLGLLGTYGHIARLKGEI